MSEGTRGNATIGIPAYLILSFGIAWVSWEALLPKSGNIDALHFTLYAFPGAFAPAIATFIVRKWVTREGFGDAGLVLHLAQWRYYLIAWFLPFAVLAFIVLGAFVLGLERPDFSISQTLAHSPHMKIPHALAGFIAYLVPLQLLIVAVITTPILFSEEFGWRGYLQLRLFAGRPTLAAVSTGIT